MSKNQLLQFPGLPDSPAKLVVVSGEYPEFIRRLREFNLEVLETDFDDRLPKPVGFHPDMQICPLDSESLFVLRESPLLQKFAVHDIIAGETEKTPQPCYPHDVLCNGFAWNRFFVGNMAAIDGRLQKHAKRIGLRELHVQQGYAACSVALVTKTAAITSDQGIAGALEKQGFEILRIRPGFIELPGYEYGFIGGCCGKLAPEVLAFSGSLKKHPDRESILKFLSHYKVEAMELTSEPLIDIGGIVPLR